MLPNPSSLQNEPTEAIESNNDGTLPLGPSEYHMQHPSIAKSTSNVNMGLEGQDERSDVEDRSEFLDDTPSDEDTDMSDGGAALTMTLSHAEQLNAELDMLDAEVMGSDNLIGLLMDNQYQPAMIEAPPFSYHGYNQGPQTSDEYDEGMMGNELGPAPAAMPNLPVAMSAVAQQLQHIQDGQGHAIGNFTFAPDAQHGAVQDNSTSPLPYHPQFSTIPLNLAGDFQNNFVSLADVSSHQVPVLLSSANAPHLWGTEVWTHSPAMDIILVSSQDQLDASHFPFSDDTGVDDDLVTNADQDTVDDQFNLSLAEFLYNWAHSPLGEDVKKRPRGPSLPAVESQREMKNTGPMTRINLQGERCDIQRINWDELGVSRLEARQMRRQTYKNYTNLRLHLQWHVSFQWQAPQLLFMLNIY